jgi:SAM-dependent methyltransferase
MVSLNKAYKNFKRKLGRALIGRNPFDLAYYYCQGVGLEVGARNNPYAFSIKSKISYADIDSSEAIKKNLFAKEHIPKKHKQGFFPEVNYVLNGPKYGFDLIENDHFDFVYSDNVLEHTPNIIFALMEQIRITKPGGFVYAVIPNKNYTFDKLRKPTPLEILKSKFHEDTLKYTLEEALDIDKNSLEHFSKNYSESDQINVAKKILTEDDGGQHFHVFDDVNTLELLKYLTEIADIEIHYFSAAIGKHIHFAIYKRKNLF